MNLQARIVATALLFTTLISSPVFAGGEVNVYSYRQPFLIKPMFDAFTRETGIKVNTVFAKKGLVERLRAEGVHSPADLIFTVDIGRLDAVLQAGFSGHERAGVYAFRQARLHACTFRFSDCAHGYRYCKRLAHRL